MRSKSAAPSRVLHFLVGRALYHDVPLDEENSKSTTPHAAIAFKDCQWSVGNERLGYNVLNAVATFASNFQALSVSDVSTQ